MSAHTSHQVSSNGGGFCGLLTILFITLKLVGVIEWSWLWVLAPVWIPFSLGILFALFCLCMAAVFNRG